MAQNVSADFIDQAYAAKRDLSYGVLVSWDKELVEGAGFFTVSDTVGSEIGGVDMLKAAGEDVAFFDLYQYANETGNVTHFSVTRKMGSRRYGVFLAQADVEFDNSSLRYMPNADAGEGEPALFQLPNRPLKIGVGFDGEIIQIFHGYTDKGPKSSLVSRTTELHAYDVIDYLNNYTLQGDVQIDKSTSEILETIMTEIGFSAEQYVIEESLQPNIGYLVLKDKKAGAVVSSLCEAEQGLFFADENGILNFWNRLHINQEGESQHVLTYSNMEDVDFVDTAVINDVLVVARPREVQSLQKVWESSSAVEINPGETIDVFADFKDDFGEMPVTSVVEPEYVTEKDTSFYTTNENRDGTGDNNNGDITLDSVYNFGNTYRMTFTNEGAAVMYLTTIQIHGTPAKVITEIEERYEDEESIGLYGRNPENSGDTIKIENNDIQDSDTAKALAFLLVGQYKDPRRRYEVKDFSMPHLQIGDVVTLEIEDTEETKTVFITGKEDTLSLNADIEQTLEVEEIFLSNFFTIELSPIGGSDMIAP